MDEMLTVFSSVYHADRGFQKLGSHKNRMPPNATAHFQSQLISCDKPVFFVLTEPLTGHSQEITSQGFSLKFIYKKKRNQPSEISKRIIFISLSFTT